jgi:hypothetical protein
LVAHARPERGIESSRRVSSFLCAAVGINPVWRAVSQFLGQMAWMALEEDRHDDLAAV